MDSSSEPIPPAAPPSTPLDSDGAPVAATRYQPLVVILAAFAAGIVWDRYWPLTLGTWLLAAGLALVLWWLAWRKEADSVATFFVLAGAVGVGAAWHHCDWHLFADDEIGRFAREESQPACVEAIALTSPRWSPAPRRNPMNSMERGEHSELLLSLRRIRDGKSWRDVSGRANAIVEGQLLGVSSGDRVRVFAMLNAPSQPLNPGEFGFADHARGERRLAHLHCEFPQAVSVVERGPTWKWRWVLNEIRDRGNQQLWRHVRSREAGLAAAVLLGSREQLDEELNKGFFTTGITHLLAISGLNVAIFAYGFWLVARVGMFPRKPSLVIAAVLAITYAVLTDSQPPVVRAAVLVVCVCVARYFGRRGLAFNTLAAAGLVVLVLNPSSLFQTGAQLSFLAVAVLCCWMPADSNAADHDPLRQLIARSRPWPVRFAKRVARLTWQMFATSAVVWLVTLPLVVYRFHLVSPVALLLNPVVMIPISIAMYAGFGVLALGWLAPPLAKACGWLCSVSLAFIERSIDFSLLLRGNHFWTPAPPAWWVLIFYAALAARVALPQVRLPQRWFVALLCAWGAVGVWLAGPSGSGRGRTQRDELACTFVAVGHGTGVLVELPGGQTLLYDAGHMGTSTTGMRAISSVLWSRGIRHLDAVVISHADLDHYNALPDLLERFSVGVVYVSPVMFQHDTVALDFLKRSIEVYGVPIRHAYANDRLRTSPDVAMEVLHPPPSGVMGSDNANSIVLSIEFAGRRILLPGDLERPGLEDVMAEEPLDCDVVMVPHHGSTRSNPSGFAQWTTPEFVVISGAHGRGVGPVEAAYRAVGSEVFHTAEDGAVRVTVNRAGITQAAAWRKTPWP